MAIYSLDIETTSLDFLRGHIISVSWCGTDLAPISRNWNDRTKAKVRAIVENPRNTIITQNGVFDYAWLVREGLEIKAKREDTMIGSHVIESNRPAGLASLVQRYLIQEILDEAGINVQVDYAWKKNGPDLWIKENKKAFKKEHSRVPHMGDCPRQLLHEYAKKDALYTLLVWYAMRDYITKQLKWSYDLDMAIVPIVIGMKLRGVPINIELCRERIKQLRIQQKKYLQFFGIEKVGPLALRNVIFPKLKIKLKYKTEKGNWKFDEKTLRRYQIAYPQNADIIEETIQYRKAKQSDKTYYTSYLFCSYKRKIYPTFNLTNAKTGRLSSSNPNLQNVKKAGEERQVFLVRPGYINVHWDYDQIELRILAHYSQERELIRIFEEGIDPHTRTAELMGITEKTAAYYLTGSFRNKPPRFIGKALNYSYWYGMGVDALSLGLGITMDKGRALLQCYRDAYPDAVSWSNSIIEEAKNVGYVEDLFGRRYYPDDHYSYYKLVNYLIQGTAAQVMKIGMLRAQKYLYKNKDLVNVVRAIRPTDVKAMQLLTIHDELGLELPDKKNVVLPIIKKLNKILTIEEPFIVPLTISSKWTRKHWQDLKETSEFPIPWKKE